MTSIHGQRAAGTGMYDLVRVGVTLVLMERGTVEEGMLVCVMGEEDVVEMGWGEE